MIDAWGNLPAMMWLCAAAAVLYTYVVYWFWKAHRVRHIDVLLGAAGATEDGEPRTANFMVYDVATLIIGVVYVGAFAGCVRLLTHSGLPVGLQLGTSWVIMLLGVALSAGLLAIIARSALGTPTSVGSMAAMVSKRSGRKQVARFTLAFLALNLVVVALMRPQGEARQREVKRKGVDIVFAIDLSKSMLADDIKPTRIDAAKQEIDQVMRRLKGDRVALVAFTSVSFAQSPLTSDYGAIRVYLDQVSPQLMPYGGTAVGRAILDGVELLTGESFLERGRTRGAPKERERSQHDQIIVIFTDGEDHESDPTKAAEEARRHGIRVYTVGFGSSVGAQVPDFDDDGTRTGFVTRNGQPVLTRLDESTLRDVATSAGGEYLRYEGEGSIAEPLVDEIDKLEKAELSSLLTENREDYFYVALLPALLLLLGASFMGDRRGLHVPFSGSVDPLARRRRFARQRRSRAPRKRKEKRSSERAAVAIVLTALFSLLGCADDGTGLLERPNPSVEAGNAALEEGEFQTAIESYLLARDALPDDPMLDYNLGLAYMQAKRYEEARAAFINALAVKPERDGGNALFRVHFGLGNAYYHLGLASEPGQRVTDTDDTDADTPPESTARVTAARYRDAVAYYRKALEHDPDSEDVRHNLELALFKLFPPCYRFEDEFEDNDQLEDAALAESEEQLAALDEARLTVCGGDADYFRLAAGAGFKVTVDATFEPLDRDELMDDSARLDYARISLALMTADGEVLASDDGPPAPTERAPVPPSSITRRLDTLEVPDTVGEDGPVFLRISAEDSAEAHYRVAINLVPPCGRFEDPFEDNDVREAAASLDGGLHDVRICPGDDDWYTFETDPGDSVFLDLLPMPNEETGITPQLEFELYAESEPKPIRTGRLDAAAARQTGLLNFEIFEWPRRDTFHLRITGFGEEDQQEGPYAMDFHHFPPCPLGDDEFEDNDDAATSAELPVEERRFRYLRHCAEDEDWYIATASRPPQDAGAPPSPAGGSGERVGFQATVEYDPRFGDIELTAYDPVTAEVLASAEVARSTTPGKQVKSLALDGALDGERIQLQVHGDPNFYHLMLSTPDENQSSQDDQQDQEEPQDPQDQEEPQDGDDQEEPQDGQNQEDENEDQGEDPQDQQDGQDPQDGEDQNAQPESGDGQDAPVEKVPGQDSADRDTGEPLSPEELKDRRINDLLDRLERSDPNLPLERARERQPDRVIENDW